MVEAQERVAQVRGYPEAIRVDYGVEFCSKEMDAWAYRNGVKLLFICPRKPTDNGDIESFNGKLRDYCLTSICSQQSWTRRRNRKPGESTTTRTVPTARWGM